MGVRHFDISGGEPFLYRDLEPLVREIKSYPDTRIDLVSNGTLIASRYEKDIRRILEKVDQVFLSLDSMDADKHDSIRRGEEMCIRDSSRTEKINRLMKVIPKTDHFVMASSMDSFHEYFDPFFYLSAPRSACYKSISTGT